MFYSDFIASLMLIDTMRVGVGDNAYLFDGNSFRRLLDYITFSKSMQ